MKAQLVGVVVAAVALALLGFAAQRLGVYAQPVGSGVATTTPAWFSYDHAHQVEYWASRVRALGADAAYKEFASQVPDLAIHHEKAHAFGGALYEAVGLAGITTCDPRFQYGCFHEFIGKAVADHGVSVVANIDTACGQAVGPSGCRHGIGHALVYYYGYTLDGLKRALVGCDTYTKVYPYEGCYAGVFMEFNTRIMLGDNGKIRPLEHNDYVYPCASLDQKYQAVCAYHQSHWWNSILISSGDSGNFAQLGELCRGLGLGDKPRLACFAGLGVVAGDSINYSKSISAALVCDSAGSNPAERLACRAIAAAFIYSATSLDIQSALDACQGLRGTALGYCTSYTVDKKTFPYPVPMPQEYGATF